MWIQGRGWILPPAPNKTAGLWLFFFFSFFWPNLVCPEPNSTEVSVSAPRFPTLHRKLQKWTDGGDKTGLERVGNHESAEPQPCCPSPADSGWHCWARWIRQSEPAPPARGPARGCCSWGCCSCRPSPSPKVSADGSRAGRGPGQQRVREVPGTESVISGSQLGCPKRLLGVKARCHVLAGALDHLAGNTLSEGCGLWMRKWRCKAVRRSPRSLWLFTESSLPAASVSLPADSEGGEEEDLQCVCLKTTSGIHPRHISSLEVIGAGLHCPSPQLMWVLELAAFVPTLCSPLPYRPSKPRHLPASLILNSNPQDWNEPLFFLWQSYAEDGEENLPGPAESSV